MHIVRNILKWILGIAFVLAGSNHFINSEFYLGIMPPYLPWHLFLVYLSGAFEVLLGVLLLIKRFQKLAAWGLIALLLAVFPANIYMAMNPERFKDISPLLLFLRLPIQFLIIAWAYWYTRKGKD
ncbi:MAG: DoxX family membrane protein [Acidobacteria bacterium]|nr:DoxX family membrane protein [Acidobacteriota bacterium]